VYNNEIFRKFEDRLVGLKVLIRENPKERVCTLN